MRVRACMCVTNALIVSVIIFTTSTLHIKILVYYLSIVFIEAVLAGHLSSMNNFPYFPVLFSEELNALHNTDIDDDQLQLYPQLLAL